MKKTSLTHKNIISRIKKSFCSLLILGALQSMTSAAIIANYDLNGSLVASGIAPSIVVSNLNLLDSTAAILDVGNTNLNLIRQTTPISTQQFFGNAIPLISFSITANTGFDVTFSSLQVNLNAGGLLYTEISQDSSSVLTTNGTQGFGGNAFSVNSGGLINFTTPYTITSGTTQSFYLRFNTGNFNDTKAVDAFILNGDIVAVPEPSSYFIISGILIGLMMINIKRRLAL